MITIVVPVYKVEEYLSRCVESILNQTYKNWQLLLVDDGSPDNCPKLCEKYAEEDSRIFVIHQKNGGLSAARNTGLNWFYEQNNSDFITFVDSDDWLHPKFLEILINGIFKNKVKISVCNYERDEQKNAKTNFDNIEYELTTPEDFLVNHSWQYNYATLKLFHKSVFEDIRFPVGKYFEDTFTTYKVLHKCKTIAYTSECLYYYFLNDSGITRAPWTTKELVIFDAMEEQLKFYKEKGLKKAYEKEFQLFVHHHAYQIVRIKQTKEDFKKNKAILKDIKKALRKYLKENKDKFNVHNMTYSYEAAYPFIMSLYALASKIKSKLLRK